MLTGADSVCYATGHIVPIETGASPFAGGPTTAFVAADGTTALVAANIEAPEANAADLVESYPGFAYQQAEDAHANYMAAISRVIARLGIGGAIAIEPATCPASLAAALGPGARLDISAHLARQRATKTPAELALLRRAAEIAAAGQDEARRAARPGRSELAAFADIRLAMEARAGMRLAVAGDFVAGRARTAAIGGWPGERLLAPGDPVIVDLAPRVAGYWGDSCGSFRLGGPAADYARLFAAARDALDLALGIMRPGLAIDELDRRLRACVARAGFAYPHHSGHSIGTSVHEYPRIVPYERSCLEADMVLMVEPGAYHPDIGGARTEWMIHVSDHGCEPLAPFAHKPWAEF